MEPPSSFFTGRTSTKANAAKRRKLEYSPVSTREQIISGHRVVFARPTGMIAPRTILPKSNHDDSSSKSQEHPADQNMRNNPSTTEERQPRITTHGIPAGNCSTFSIQVSQKDRGNNKPRSRKYRVKTACSRCQQLRLSVSELHFLSHCRIDSFSALRTGLVKRALHHCANPYAQTLCIGLCPCLSWIYKN